MRSDSREEVCSWSACSACRVGPWRVGLASVSPGGSRRAAPDSASSPRGPVLRRSSGRSSGLSVISPPLAVISGVPLHGSLRSPVTPLHIASAASRDPGGAVRADLLYIRPMLSQNAGAWLVRRAISNRRERSYHSACRQDTPCRGGAQSEREEEVAW